MNTTHNLKKMIAAALLSGGLALTGMALSAGTANAFNPQPEPPGKPIPTTHYGCNCRGCECGGGSAR